VNKTFFVGSFVIGLGASACDKDPGPPTALITVEKLVADSQGNSCYAPCPGSNAPSSDLTALSQRCPGTTAVTCGFSGGVDQSRIVVDYEQTEIANSSGFIGPQVQFVGDGSVLLTGNLIAGPLATGPQHPFAAGEFFVPNQLARSLQIRTTLLSSDILATSAALDVSVTPGTIALPGCPQGPALCELQLQVGTQAVTVAVPSDTGLQTATVTTFVDDVPGTTIQVPLVLAPGAVLSGTQFLQVPASGKAWTIGGSAGSVSLTPVQVSLAEPKLGVTIENCSATACTLVAGTNATIAVSAPGHTQVSTASITTRTDSIDVAGAVTQALQPCANGLACATFALSVPSPPVHSWQVVAQIGNFQVASQVATISQ